MISVCQFILDNPELIGTVHFPSRGETFHRRATAAAPGLVIFADSAQ
jgi:hypothetical protein